MAAPDQPEHTIPPTELRSALSRFPTGVTVVTAMTDHGPAGLSANSVTSLSLDPPLMLTCLDRGARTLRAVESAGRFAVNVLGVTGEPLARRFGQKLPMEEKWAGVGWADEGGIPWLDDAIVFIACSLRDVISGGDHVIVTGEVEAIHEREGAALLFADGSYRALG